MQLLSSAFRAICLVPGLIVLGAPRRELQSGPTRNIENEKEEEKTTGVLKQIML
jgi:hypothetical protein